MVATAVAISVVSASIAFVGLVVSALAFARSSPAKVYKREQDKVMRKLATQTLLMNRIMSLIVSASNEARREAQRLRRLYDDGHVQDGHMAPDLQDYIARYDGGVVEPAQERHLLLTHMRSNGLDELGGLSYVLCYSQELAKRLDSAIEEALSHDLWGFIVQLPTDLLKLAAATQPTQAADSSLTVPSDTLLHANYAFFRQSLQWIASLDEEALGTSAFQQPHFFHGVIRMFTSCQAYHRHVSSTSSAPLVAALDDSNSGWDEKWDDLIYMSWALKRNGRSSLHAVLFGEAPPGAGDACRGEVGSQAHGQQQRARAGAVHGCATSSAAARGASLTRDRSCNLATGSRAGSTRLDIMIDHELIEMADCAQMPGASRDHARPPQVSASTASTSRAAQQATTEIRSVAAVPRRAHREGPASVRGSTETAPGTDASQSPRPQGHLSTPGAESAAATVRVQVGRDKAASARELGAPGSESASQSQQQ